MRNLVWTFWFALILAIIGTFLTSVFLVKQWNSFLSYSQLEDRPNYPLQTLSIKIQTAINENRNLNNLLVNSPINEFGKVYLINSKGFDVLNRALPDAVTLFLEGKSLKREPIFSRAIKSGGGEILYLIFHADSPALLWKLFKRFGIYWVLFATFVISGFIAWWLALKIARPIQHIASASRFEGEGNISPRINKKILERHDEIGELARQLQQSGDKIQELLKKQKDFLRDVSHEVRTPLARLQVAADTLELEIKDGRALKQIKAEVIIIDQLVQDLLHLSQFDRPMHSHKLETISVFTLVDQCMKSSKILANKKNISLNVQSKHCQNIHIAGIRFLLDRALDNLINNAIRHSPEHSTIKISCEIDKENCCLGVWDQGDGVKDESLQEIFEPFFRSDTSRNRQTGGFGLGLSLVKRIVELHEGSVNAFNCPGGFVVKMLIPLSKNTIAATSDVAHNV